MCKVTIDGAAVEVPEGSTILDAAKLASVDIPTLCYMAKINEIGSCRVCVVEVEGQDGLAAACNTPVFDGMSVRTATPRAISARRQNVKTILAGHRSECTTCKRSGTCALQNLANSLGVADLERDPVFTFEAWDGEFPLQRDATKCIRCMRCVAECAKVQHCSVWEMSGPASYRGVRVVGGAHIADAGCALCGQCVTHCPTGALTARDDTDNVLAALADPQTITVVQVAPAIRSAWGEGVGLAREQATQGRMVSALRALGFDYVFDTDFGADLTIMEEANEFIEWVKEGKPRPMFTSCCPGWVRFAKLHYPQFVAQLSSSKSPHQMLGATAKALLSEQAAEQGKRIFCRSVKCRASPRNTRRASRSCPRGRPDVDAVTTREFDRMLRMFNVDCAALPEQKFDDPLGTSTQRGNHLRAHGWRDRRRFVRRRSSLRAKIPTVNATPRQRRPISPGSTRRSRSHAASLAIASGLENTSALLDALESGEASYDFVEIMVTQAAAGGGGQPSPQPGALRASACCGAQSLDGADVLRYSHENPDIAALYERLYERPLSEKAGEAVLRTDSAYVGYLGAPRLT